MDEDLETFIKRYKTKIVDQLKPFRREDSTNLNQMAGLEIPPQDIGDNLQQKWNVDKLSSFQSTNRANVFSDSRVNNDFLSKLGVYEEKRRRLQALRKEEYNMLLSEKQKMSNNRRNFLVEPEKIFSQPYEEILEKKRQEEKEYRRITNQFDPVVDDKSVSNVNSDTSIMSSVNFTQASSKDPSKENMASNKLNKVVRFEEEHGGVLQIGKELDVDEMQKRKEQYRLELRKQIDEAEALKKKKHNRVTKSSSSTDSSSKFSSPNNNNNFNSSNNNINNNFNNNNKNNANISSSNNVEMNPLPTPAPLATNPPITSFHPPQPLNFQHLPSFPLLAPTPFYGPSIVPTTVFLQQPGIHPAAHPAYYTGTLQLPTALNQFNNDFSAVTNSPLLPQYLRLIENQSGNLNNFQANQLATLSSSNNPVHHSINNNNEQQEQSKMQRQQQQQQAGVLEAFLLGGDEKNEADKKKKYQQELKNQIEEAKRKKQKQKEEDDNYDRRLQEELERYHTRKDTLKTTNQDFEPASEKKSSDNEPKSPDENANTSDPQNQSNHARGGNGIFGEPMSEEQRKTKSKYQDDLLKQIEDKKKRENEEKERKKKEDEVFLRKIEEEKKKMEEEFEEEKRKALEKKQAEDKRRDDEAKLREEKMLLEAEKKKQEQNIEKPNESQPAERVASRQIQNRQKSPPIPALRSSKHRKIQTFENASRDSGQVLSLLSKMKTELDLRKIKADKIFRKISQENFQTTAKQQIKSTPRRTESRSPEDTSGAISSSSAFTIGKADLTTSLESIGSPKVRSKSNVNKARAASKPTPPETPKIKGKPAKTTSAKLQNKLTKDMQSNIAAKNLPEKSKTKDGGSTSASLTSLQSMPISKKSSSPDLKEYVDYEAELLEDLLKKKKQVDSNLRRALRDLDKLSDEPLLSSEKSNLRNSTVSLYSTENMTDEERLLSATSRSLREKFKEIDQRPFSVNSLDPEELSRQNEERLKRLRVLTDEMISRNHSMFNTLPESSVDHLKTNV